MYIFFIKKKYMNNKVILSYQNLFYNIERESTESNEEFFSRCWYIVKNKPITEEELNKIILKSKINRNKVFLNLDYNF